MGAGQGLSQAPSDQQLPDRPIKVRSCNPITLLFATQETGHSGRQEGVADCVVHGNCACKSRS